MEITVDNIINFNPDDWDFRRSSGCAGYDHKDHPNNEQKWIYQEDYVIMKNLQNQYVEDQLLLNDFCNNCVGESDNQESVIEEFLKQKYNKILNEKHI